MTIIDEKHIVRKPRSNRNYINGPDFHKALTEYYIKTEGEGQDIKTQSDIPPYIGECIMHIANNLAKKINFTLYTFKEDLVGDAIEKMIEAVRLRKYDPSLSQNPFGYFSQISWNSFLQRIAKEKKEGYIKHNNFQNLTLMDQFSELSIDNDEHNKVLEGFEKTKDKDSSAGYTKHRNLSYEKNRKKKILTEPLEKDIIE